MLLDDNNIVYFNKMDMERRVILFGVIYYKLIIPRLISVPNLECLHPFWTCI